MPSVNHLQVQQTALSYLRCMTPCPGNPHSSIDSTTELQVHLHYFRRLGFRKGAVVKAHTTCVKP